MDLLIKDGEERILYGHQLSKHIVKTGEGNEAMVCSGVEPELFLAYVGAKFPENRDVKALLESGTLDGDLLEAVSDSIELTPLDAEVMKALQDHYQGND